MFKVQCILTIVYVVIINPYEVNVSLRDGNLIHSFWVTNGSIRIKVTELSQSQEVSHIWDLEELFPGNHCLADMSSRE